MSESPSKRSRCSSDHGRTHAILPRSKTAVAAAMFPVSSFWVGLAGASVSPLVRGQPRPLHSLLVAFSSWCSQDTAVLAWITTRS